MKFKQLPTPEGANRVLMKGADEKRRMHLALYTLEELLDTDIEDLRDMCNKPCHYYYVPNPKKYTRDELAHAMWERFESVKDQYNFFYKSGK